MEQHTIPNNRRAAELLVKYIQKKLTEPEEIELDEWIIDQDNYYLFEKLTSPANSEWSATWFSENGVNPQFLKKPFPIYETPEEKETKREFYFWSGLMTLVMIIYYIIIRFA